MIDSAIRFAMVLLHLLEERRDGFARWQNAILGSQHEERPTSPWTARWGLGVGVGVALATLYVAGVWWPAATAAATGFVVADAVAHVAGSVWGLLLPWYQWPRWYRAAIWSGDATVRSPGVISSLTGYAWIGLVDGHLLLEHPVGWVGALPIAASWAMAAVAVRRWR